MNMHSSGVDAQNFGTARKIHATIASWLATFTLLYALTVAAPVVPMLPKALNTTQTLANFAFSAPMLGVFFAPLYTPHLSDLVGRKLVYVSSLTLLMIFIAAISQAKSINTLIVLRVLAGFFGGPLAVLIEGTHADVWPSERTVSYYCSVALSQYWGAAFGPIIGAQALKYGGVPWTAYSALVIGGVAWLFVVTMPETFGRQSNSPLSGQRFRLTVIDPMLMLVSEPLVIMGALLLGLSFGVVFQFFISIPMVLQQVYNITNAMPFFAAVAGSGLAFATSIALEAGTNRTNNVEKRLIPAMLGVFLTALGLFWIAWSAKPDISPAIPVTGTAIYVWGNMSIVLSVISYFFDALHPEGILSALTALATFRIAAALLVPIFILDMFAALTPPWSLSVFGFIHLAFVPLVFVMFVAGERLRLNSRFMDKSAVVVNPGYATSGGHNVARGVQASDLLNMKFESDSA